MEKYHEVVMWGFIKLLQHSPVTQSITMFGKGSLKLLAVLLSLTCSMSCQKGANETIETTRKELILGSWQMTAHLETPATYDFDADGVKDTDTYQYMGSCFTDNYTTFKSDGTCDEQEGPTTWCSCELQNS